MVDRDTSEQRIGCSCAAGPSLPLIWRLSRAGVPVAVAPRIAAYVAALWLGGIIVNLLTLSGYYDVALRDFGLLVGALALARLSDAEHVRAHEMHGVAGTV